MLKESHTWRQWRQEAAKEAETFSLSLLISHWEVSRRGCEGWGRQSMKLHSLTMENMKVSKG